MSSTLIALLACVLGADAKIVAPPTGPVGQFILIDGAESQGALAWTVTDPEVSLFVSPDSKQIVVYSPSARKTLVTLKATDSAGESVDYHVLKLTGDSPEPAPAPTPDKPKPKPDAKPVGPPKPLPPGKFSVAQPCCDEACKVQGNQRKAEADLLAQHLAELRDRIKSDKSMKVSDLHTMQGEVFKSTKGLPPALRSRWMEWAKWWGAELCTQSGLNRLVTAADWVAFIDETILGLKAVM